MADFRDFFENHPDVVSLDTKDGGLFGKVADLAQRSPERLREVLGEVQKMERDNKRRRRGGSS